MAQDEIDEEPFSYLELPDNFSISSNKCQGSVDRHNMDLDETSLLKSKTEDFLNATESTAYEAAKKLHLTQL